MKTLKEILFINESEKGWTVSFLRPEFQGGEAVEISEEEARGLMKLIS